MSKSHCVRAPRFGATVAPFTNIAIRESGQSLFPLKRLHGLVCQGWQFRIGRQWHVVLACDCGQITVMRCPTVRHPSVVSCGCVGRELSRRRVTTHGQSHTKLFKAWRGMIDRCKYKDTHNWKYYGGKGISVCASWATSFETFRDWALANGYQEGLSLDRIKSDKNYEPSNCEWVTVSENTKRMHKAKRVIKDGE